MGQIDHVNQAKKEDLFKAAKSGDVSAFQSLPPDALSLRNEHACSLLHVAVSSSHPEVVKILSEAYEASSVLNLKDERGWTPLHLAVSIENAEIVKILLSKGADVNIKNDDDHTTYYYSFRQGSVEIPDLLILHRFSKPAEKHIEEGKYGMTMKDEIVLLASDPGQPEALKIHGKVKVALGSGQDLQNPSSFANANDFSSICLKTTHEFPNKNSVSKKVATLLEGSVSSPTNKLKKHNAKTEFFSEQFSSNSWPIQERSLEVEVGIQLRPVKFIYDHDIRLVKFPVNYTFMPLYEKKNVRGKKMKFRWKMKEL